MADGWRLVSGDTGGTVAGLATAISAGAETLVFAATPVGVYRSTDLGQSWSLPGPGTAPTVALAEALTASPFFARDVSLFASGSGGLYRSSDAGETWHQVLTDCHAFAVHAIAGESGDQMLVLVATEDDGVLRSDDGGRTWTGVNAGLLDLTAMSLSLSPCFESDRTGFVGTASGLYRTRNGARSWREVDTGVDQPGVQCLAVSPNFSSDRLVLAGTEGDGLLRSDDGGTTWSRPAALADSAVTALAFGPSAAVVAAATDAGIALSNDGGQNWEIIKETEHPVLSLAFVGDTLLAGQLDGGIIRSADSGISWQIANAGLNAQLDTQIAVMPDGSLVVRGLEEGSNVPRTSDVSVATLPEGVNVTGVASSGRTVVASTNAGVFLSSDGGKTFIDWSEGLLPPRVVSVALSGRDVYALGLGGAVWRRDLA